MKLESFEEIYGKKQFFIRSFFYLFLVTVKAACFRVL